MSGRATFRVSTKAALFSPDFQRVMAIDLRPWGKNYGMPGGHIETGEMPDEAIRRELAEELGLTEQIPLRHCDFFWHGEGKIVLAYCGTLDPEQIDMTFDGGEGKPVWLAIDDIKSGAADIGDYHDLVLRLHAGEALAL